MGVWGFGGPYGLLGFGLGLGRRVVFGMGAVKGPVGLGVRGSVGVVLLGVSRGVWGRRLTASVSVL